ncbi:MAG: hypothetical protein C4538_02600 [Nitrospiraceae bacterium]|nr:MAG: hypothetical protein C4538_02600 [Nitrospiraceae bacterium]
MNKRISRHAGIWIVILLLGVLFAGCPGILTTPIGKIHEDPRHYSGKAVTISGEVTEVFGFFGIKYFSVKDKTGEITVVTDKPLPKKGAAIRVKGTVKEAFSIGDSHLIVIVENGQK